MNFWVHKCILPYCTEMILFSLFFDPCLRFAFAMIRSTEEIFKSDFLRLYFNARRYFRLGNKNKKKKIT